MFGILETVFIFVKIKEIKKLFSMKRMLICLRDGYTFVTEKEGKKQHHLTEIKSNCR